MADRDQRTEQQDGPPGDEPQAVQDLDVVDETAVEVKGGVGSLNYTSVQQTYKGQ
jgi:hypothetical protein